MLKSNKVFLFVAALLLALAPFQPEPHLFGKLRWVAGGALGMSLKDWIDLLMHGLPITLVSGYLIWDFFQKTEAE